MELETVKMIPVVIMLCSGFVHFTCANHLRIFSGSKVQCTEHCWNAPQFCRDKNESLVTVYDEGDITFIQTYLKYLCERDGPYLGLKWSNQSSRWSDRTPYIYNKSIVNVSMGQPFCVGIVNNEWTAFKCSDRMYFMCYRGNNYHLIETKKTWCQAQLYCRKEFTDLVSISNDTQNHNVTIEGQNKTFWIGLVHDDGEWEDGSCSTYRHGVKFDERQRCTILNERVIEKRECDGAVYEPSVCSKGRVRIIIVNKTRTWEEAFDYCEKKHSGLLQIEDAEDQRAVNQWLTISPGGKNSTGGSQLFWIALRQSRMFGFWIWRDRTVSNNNWKDGRIPERPLSDNCGVINSTDFKWRDENCWHKLPFLCEEEILLPKENRF